ncbi:MAG TPA: hypothetical protein VHR72_12995 [Gemmataceae bacterium]|nr:hypothetical protein [Gemmataceae bacterium]
MWRIRLSQLAGCCIAVVAVASLQAQEIDLKAILRQAIEAHGGEKQLAKLHAGISKYKGKMKLLGQMVDIVGENSVQRPDKLRSSLDINIGGMTINVVTVFDGKKFWVSSMGNTKEIDDEKTIDEVKQSLMTEIGSGFTDMLKAPFELSAIGETKVKENDTFGIRVSKKGQRDISYFFDKKTHLLAKIETRNYDPMTTKEVTQEKIILEYQDKNGFKVGKRVEILKDGDPFMEIEITDVDIRDKLDPSTFAMP